MNATGQQPSGLHCTTTRAATAASATASSGCLDTDLPSHCDLDSSIKHSTSQDSRLGRSPAHGERPRPGRRRRTRQLQLQQQEQQQRWSLSSPPSSAPRSRMQRSRKSSSLYLSTLIFVLAWCCICCSPVAASIAPTDIVLDEYMNAELARLEQAGEILVDAQPPPPNAAELRRRQDNASETGSTSITDSTATPTTNLPSTTNSNSAPSSTTTSIATDPGSSDNGDLPKPFDSGLGANYTSDSCPTFLKSFLANSALQSCLPFSLLLQNSQSFFQAEKNIVRITQALDATCNVNLQACVSSMAGFARALKLDNNCGQDYKNQNPLVVQAYQGLLAYEPLYHAGCLKATSTGSYCFANAITNTTSAADSYPYFLPLGVSLPGGARPTCDGCLQSTMAIFSTFAANASQPLSGTYVPAAQQINIGCGPTFVNATVHISQSSHSLQAPPLLTYLVLTAFLLLNYLFQ